MVKTPYDKFVDDKTRYSGFIRLNVAFDYNPYGKMLCTSVESDEENGLKIEFSSPEIGTETIYFDGIVKSIYHRVLIPYLKDAKFYIEDDGVALNRSLKVDNLDKLIRLFESYFVSGDYEQPQFPFNDSSYGIFYERYPLTKYSSLTNIEILTISEKAKPINVAEFIALNM